MITQYQARQLIRSLTGSDAAPSTADHAAADLLTSLKPGDLAIIRSWLDRGYTLTDSLINSRLLSGGRRHPLFAEDASTGATRMIEWRTLDLASQRDRQVAEHESAHAWTALGLGAELHSVTMKNADGDGETRYSRPSDPINRAAIAMAGDIWVAYFAADRFPGGPVGCDSDHRNALAATDYDMVRNLPEAQRRAHQQLRTYQADVLALADRLQRERTITY